MKPDIQWIAETILQNTRSIIPAMAVSNIPRSWDKRKHQCWWSNNTYLFLMMTSSNGNIFRVTGPLCGEFTGPGEFPTQRPVTQSFDVFFDLRLDKRLSKQPWGGWVETPSWSLWRQCNVVTVFILKTWPVYGWQFLCETKSNFPIVLVLQQDYPLSTRHLPRWCL